MAFIIEKLTEEQKKEFSSWKIKEPVLGFRRIIREEEMTAPWEWTVDHDRKIYLIGDYVDIHFPNEKIFIFIWNNEKYLVQFSQSWKDDYTVVWNIPTQYFINNKFPFCDDTSFIDNLREALKIYGAFGTLSDLNRRCNVIINF